ncbi:hypothetical protein B1H20_17045 [Streptomyces violaceoruber]|uniref:Uncharacterized protein n=1 Tax=Streptomyces violaceoruber TaxID=1935 RepID=A0A1V0UCE9_STRVN|nr:hypothetical protein [Streptomyces violaceoruber]ARF62904.1 hypothetical protein B1H20_17045 [Streptomyces violaceoruber]
MLWQPGMRITDLRLNDFTPIPLTSTATPASGFTVSTFSGRRAGGVTEWTLILIRSGASLGAADSAGNIGDIACATLPPDCRPADMYVTSFDKAGTASGSVRILPSGVCTLTSMDPTSSIASGASVNFAGTFVTG